jgi:pantothenate kinase
MPSLPCHIEPALLLVLLAVGDDILVLLGLHVVVGQELLLLSLLVIVDVSVDVEATEQHLKRRTTTRLALMTGSSRSRTTLASFKVYDSLVLGEDIAFHCFSIYQKFVLTRKDTM